MTLEETIIPPDLKIPGVSNNSELVHWIKDEKIVLHPNLTIEESKLGGIGLFFTPDESIEYPDSDFEILRIPRESSFCLDTLIKPLEEIKERDLTVFPGTVPIKESELVINFLNTMEPSSETHIILTYFFAFKTIQNIRLKYPKNSYYAKSPLRKLDIYLDILCNTFTIKYPQHKTHDDDFILGYIEMSNKFRLEYESLIEQLKILHREDEGKFEFTELFPFEDCFQIYQAVRSRILEIPRSIKGTEIEDMVSGIENNLADLSISLDANAKKIIPIRTNEDYVIDISLVPILDFANHCHENNAYFDIERESDLIILKLKRDEFSNNLKKFEVTISYNPEDNIKDFMSTYGFQPQLLNEGNYQLFELKLQNLNKFIPDGELLCKWLKILPQIQIVFNKDEIYLNMFSNNLPLLFIDGLSYNKDWLDLLLAHFIKFNDIPEGYDTKINGEELTNLFLYQEKEYDYINGVDPIGVKFKDSTLPNLSSILEVTQADFDELINKTIEFIVNVYCRDLIKTIKQLQIKNNFDELINNYQNLEINLCNRIIEKYENEHDANSLILPEKIAKIEWEIEYRSKPRELTLDE